jgi:UPF0755 protein
LTTRRRILIAGVALFGIFASGALVLRQSVQSAVSEPGQAAQVQEIEVAPGTTLRSVLGSLEQRGLIKNAKLFEYYLRFGPEIGTDIKAGRYKIAPGQKPLEILRQLVDGKVVLESLTIVEGWQFVQMRTLLAKHPKIRQTLNGRSDAEVMAALGQPKLTAEGRFAADTYSFAPDTTDLAVLRLAFEAQQKQLDAAWNSRQPGLPLATPDEALTLASIVEKETGLASERPRIAGVFVNRLRLGMRLQSDPTVIYGIGNRYDGNIRRSDLTTDTPYNTYTRKGLPPTPIALPGRDAIIAVMHPEKTDALFFVAIGDGSGGHYFSATVTEHNNAVRRYLDRLRRDPPL